MADDKDKMAVIQMMIHNTKNRGQTKQIGGLSMLTP